MVLEKLDEKITSYVYVLLLENNKWYVGKTNDLDNRIKEHKRGRGSMWTKINKVKNVKEIIPNGSEKTTTLKYMKEYGYDNVRGFSWTQSKPLSPNQIRTINRYIS